MSNRTLTLMMGLVAFLILAIGVVFVVVVASGGDDDSKSASDDSGGPGKSPTPRRSPGAGGGSLAQICSGNTMIVPGSDPNSILDPIQVRDDATSEYIVEIFGGLMTLDRDLKPQPDIAESYTVSADKKTYTFKLRDNVVFSQSGRRVTANDVKYSLERAADPTQNSPTVTVYLGNIQGLKDRYANKAKDVSGIKVVDDRTIQITLNEPADYFISELTYPVSFVVDKDQIEKDPRNWTRKPNGTGPFKLAEFTPAEKIRLTRNDRYHLGAAKLDEVVFELGGGSILTRYENNEIHIGYVPPIELQSIKDGKSALSKEYYPQNEMAVYYIAFNVKKAPFDDPLVRQAMAMAVDFDNINNVLFFGSQRVAKGILPPEMPGFDKSITGYKYDPQKAKDLLAQSRYAKSMPRIVLTFGGASGDAPDSLTAMQSAWKDVLGIQVDLQASDYSAYLRELRRGTFQMFDAGWIADYPDPEDFLDKLFSSDSLQNEQGYQNTDVDNLLKQARSESDREKRFDLYHQAERKILEDAAVIPTFWPVMHTLVKPCIKNYPQTSMTVPKYRYIEIDPKAR